MKHIKALMIVLLLQFMTITVMGMKPCNSETEIPFEWQSGDLIFQESATNGEISRAIKGVTSSIDDYRFTHVGMVYIDEHDSIYVVEATHPRVALTPLNDYLYPLKKETPKSLVFRLKPEYHHCIPAAIEEGLKLLGKEYDYAYTLNDDKYYCSELIYEMLLRANGGKPVFILNTMTFKSPDTGEFLPEWVEHYKKLETPIPEGKPGINPGAMSKSQVVDMVYVVAEPYNK